MTERAYYPIWRSLRDGFPNTRQIVIECHIANAKKIYKGVKKERWMDQDWPYRDHARLAHEIEPKSGGIVHLKIMLVAYRRRELISKVIKDAKP